MDPVGIVKNGSVMEITLDRPPVNAISQATSYALHAAFDELAKSPDLLVGILTARGRIFSAGWDLKEFSQQEDQTGPTDLGPGGLGGFTENWQLKKPVIAAVNGHAIGGGCEMLFAADIIVAAEGATFKLPETRVGMLPDGGGIQRISKRLPYNVATDLILTGRAMSAAEAMHWGLVKEVVPAGRVLLRAREIAAEIVEGAPLAVVAAKEVLEALHFLPARESFEKTRSGWRGQSGMPHYEAMLRSDDYREGSRAFVERRKPNWSDAQAGSVSDDQEA